MANSFFVMLQPNENCLRNGGRRFAMREMANRWEQEPFVLRTEILLYSFGFPGRIAEVRFTLNH
jgi:hypothetical protein